MDAASVFRASDGCGIAYRLDGDDQQPVLVLSNSIATNLHMWDGQVADLAGHFRVLRYDTRGHGASDAPDGPYALERLGRDVLELLDSLGVRRAHFCGLSLGGFVGQWLGVHAPDRLDRLVLSNTAPYLGPPAQWDELIRTLLAERNMAVFADMFIRNWFPQEMRDGRADVVDAFRSMVLATRPEGLAGCFAVVRDTDLRPRLASITAPTLVIGGRDDTVTLANHSEAIADAIPGAEITLLPGVHMLNVERPTEFLSRVTAFLLAENAGV